MVTDRRPSQYRSRASPRHTGRRRDHPAVQRACVSATDFVRAYFGTYVDKRATPDGSRRKTTLRRQVFCRSQCVDQVLRTHRPIVITYWRRQCA
jgi:hypothetical protein